MDWRQSILDSLPPSDLVIATDGDGLLLEEGLQGRLRAKGYDVLSYEEVDPIAFRVLYEREYREHGRLVVRTPPGGPQSLPFDLLRRGEVVRVGLDTLFPSLHYGTLRALPLHVLDRVASNASARSGSRLSEQETVELVLRRVYEVDPSSIRSPEELLRVLLRLHHRGTVLPAPLQAYVVRALRGVRTRKGGPVFEGWALNAIVADREAFFTFLQERWPLFVEASAGGTAPERPEEVREPASLAFAVPGPPFVPFGHDDIRVYIDNLFLEGHLRPIDAPANGHFPSWMEVGLQTDIDQDRRRRLAHLLETADERLPLIDAPHTEWTAFSRLWSELQMLSNSCVLGAERLQALSDLRQRVNEQFEAWVIERYDLLRTQSPKPPTMVHHIPSWLDHRRREGSGRVALVVFDGMGGAQWAAMVPLLSEQLVGIELRTDSVFAWLPSITPVSRQAAFCGEAPHYFAATVDRSDDRKGWERFWERHELPTTAVAYRNVKGEDVDWDAIEEVIDDHRIRALGVVVRKVDDIVHGSQLGMATTISEVQQWVQSGWPARLIRSLTEAGFEVVITSDHGNVEAQGIGRPSSGVRAAGRGERVWVYDSEAARARDADEVPGAIAWTPAGLPPAYEPLFAPHGKAFTASGYSVVAHGGISLDEVVVPLVHVVPARVRI